MNQMKGFICILGHSCEGQIDVDSRLCACLHEGDWILLQTWGGTNSSEDERRDLKVRMKSRMKDSPVPAALLHLSWSLSHCSCRPEIRETDTLDLTPRSCYYFPSLLSSNFPPDFMSQQSHVCVSAATEATALLQFIQRSHPSQSVLTLFLAECLWVSPLTLLPSNMMTTSLCAYSWISVSHACKEQRHTHILTWTHRTKTVSVHLH